MVFPDLKGIHVSHRDNDPDVSLQTLCAGWTRRGVYFPPPQIIPSTVPSAHLDGYTTEIILILGFPSSDKFLPKTEEEDIPILNWIHSCRFMSNFRSWPVHTKL